MFIDGGRRPPVFFGDDPVRYFFYYPSVNHVNHGVLASIKMMRSVEFILRRTAWTTAGAAEEKGLPPAI